MSSRFSFNRSGTESSTGTSSSGSSAWSRPSIIGRAMTWKEKEKKRKELSLVEEFYSTYELDWDLLRAWLAARFPELEFGEQYDSSGDYYRFRIPRKLTEVSDYCSGDDGMGEEEQKTLTDDFSMNRRRRERFGI